MSARIILGGRVVWSTVRRAPPVEPYNPAEYVNDDERAAARAARELERATPTVGVPFVDHDEQVTYRVLAHLDPAQGWALADTVLGWYSIAYHELLDFVRRGFVDAAVERGSAVKRFRVLDPGRIERDVRNARDREKRREARRGRVSAAKR